MGRPLFFVVTYLSDSLELRRQLQNILGDLAIVFERASRLDAELLQFTMIGAHRFLRLNRAIGDLAHQGQSFHRRFREIKRTSTVRTFAVDSSMLLR